MSKKADRSGKTVACPMCEEPAAVQYKPFCSRRCADLDLHRWLNGGYAIPAAEQDDNPDDFDRETLH